MNRTKNKYIGIMQSEFSHERRHAGSTHEQTTVVPSGPGPDIREDCDFFRVSMLVLTSFQWLGKTSSSREQPAAP